MNTLNHKIYQLIQNDIVIFEHEIFEVTYHEMLNYIQDNLKNQNKVNYYIKEKINIPNKKYDIISNIIRYDSISLNYCIKADYNNISVNYLRDQIEQLLVNLSKENYQNPEIPEVIISKKPIRNNNIVIRDDNNNVVESKDIINEITKENKINEVTKEEKLKQLKDMIQKMEQVKNNKLNILEEKRRKNEEEKEKIMEENSKIQQKKQYDRLVKDKIKELKNIYRSDIAVYHKIKDNIESTEETQIPVLLKAKYPIIKFLELNNLLDDENSYILFKKIYYTLYDHDTDSRKYYGDPVYELNEEEENIYVEFFSDIDDKIKEFINNLSNNIIDVEKIIENRFGEKSISNTLSL